MTSHADRNVVIAGGGVAGVEAALALRALAQDRVRITMLDPSPFLSYRPLAVGVPFGGARAIRVELAAIAADRGFAVVADRVRGVDLARRTVTTQSGDVVAYDDLVLALGAEPKA